METYSIPCVIWPSNGHSVKDYIRLCHLLESGVTHKVVEQLCISIEFVDEAAQTKGSGSAKCEQRIVFPLESCFQENPSRICDRYTCRS